MQCTHGQAVLSWQFDMSCKRCKGSKALESNRQNIRRIFKGCGGAIKETFFTLIKKAQRFPEDEHFFVVEEVDEKSYNKTFLAYLVALNNLSPRVIYYDQTDSRVFVFNPFIRNQRWTEVIGEEKPAVSNFFASATENQQTINTEDLFLNRRVEKVPLPLIDPYQGPDGGGQIRLKSSPAFQPLAMAGMIKALKEGAHNITPIIVRRKKNGHVELLAGERRFVAAKKAGLSYLLGFILPLNTPDNVAHKIMVTDNSNRAGLTFVELAIEAARLQKMGMTIDQAAFMLDRSTQSIKRVLPVTQLSIKILHVINASRVISQQQALLLLKFATEELQMKALRRWVDEANKKKTNQQRRLAQQEASAKQIATIPSQQPRSSAPASTGKPTKKGMGTNILMGAGVKTTVDGTTPRQEQIIIRIGQLATALTTANSVLDGILNDNDWNDIHAAAENSDLLFRRLIHIGEIAQPLIQQLKKLVAHINGE